MIDSVSISNFGPLKELSLNKLGHINLFIGPNRSGKTIFLKAIYSALRTVEMFRRGKNLESDKEILFKKLYWTFQSDKIGNLVRRPDQGNLYFNMTETDGGSFNYSFSSSAEKQINKVSNSCEPRNINSIFIPSKEILSLVDTIIFEREVRLNFGFDDTYYDLAKALKPASKGKISKKFIEIRNLFETAINGRLRYSKDKSKWEFVQDGFSFDISLTSEGTKKLAIFDTLLGNHFLSKGSVVFIDEPEAGLHPQMVVKLLDIISILADKYDMQFFIASHSYFVIKRLYLLAQSLRINIPVISFGSSSNGYTPIYGNLKDGMPDNPIIDESIKLYREEMSL